MKEEDIIFNFSQKLNITYKEANDTINTIFDCIKEEIINGGKVKLVDFGSFEIVKRAPRKGHNPHTGEVFDIPACNEPIFKAGKALKDLVNK